jgi:3-oxoacyl-[acyl-carrier protein] reductase
VNLGLEERVALVCGASQGLGRGAAGALAAEGARVALVARRADTLRAAADAIARAHRVETLALVADLVEPGACERVVRETVERFGRLDVLVANAGGPPPGSIDAMDDEAWRRGFELTFLSTVRLARAAVAPMKEQKWGRIAIIGSGSMVAPIHNLALSSGLRPGLRGVAKMLAESHARDGITVNIVAPGLIRTERLVELAQVSPDAAQGPAAVFGRWASEIPAGRLGEPEEVGAAVAFLCSEQAAYVTGQVLLVDGGRHRAL